MSETSRPSDRRPALPGDLPLLRRSAVRLVVVDAGGKVLLFHTHDADHPAAGQWWELPGGGIDAGETYLEAAVRELREETGMVIAPSQVGAPSWRRAASFRHRKARHVQDEVVVAVRLDGPGGPVDESRRLDYEREDYFGFRWWTVGEIAAHAGPAVGSAAEAQPVSRQPAAVRFYPGRLPEFIRPFLAGEEIDEPFELWS